MTRTVTSLSTELVITSFQIGTMVGQIGELVTTAGVDKYLEKLNQMEDNLYALEISSEDLNNVRASVGAMIVGARISLEKKKESMISNL